MTPSQGRFFSAIVFLLAGTVTLFLPRGRLEGWVSILVVVVSYLLVALNLYREGREDPDAVLLWFGGVLLSVAFVVGVYLLAAFQPLPWLKPLAALTSVLGFAVLAWTWKRQTAPPDASLPNFLQEMEPRGPIRETNRVQFTALLRPGGGTEPHWIDLTFQNCCTASRTISFRFRGPWTRKVKVPVQASFRLGPAEVLRLSLPVVTPEKEGTNSVDLLIPILGKGGRRVRLRRAWSSQIRSTTPAGSIHFRLDPLPAAQWDATFPASRTAILWQPQPGSLPA